MQTIYDPFDELAKPFAVATIHNVLLLDVQPGQDGYERLSVERDGKARELVGGARWSEQLSRRDLGRHGYLVPAPAIGQHGPASRTGGCYFRAYVDPSLRRVPELDDERGGRGWVCEAQPHGFIAPPNIQPGEGGRYVADETVELTLRVPPEFDRECRRLQRTPKQVLEGFIADAAGIQNYTHCPRADGFGSNGSDERDMAESWLQRAFGMDAIDLDAVEAAEEENEQRRLKQEDFGSLLADYTDHGGQAEDLFATVQGLVNEQRDKPEDVR